MFISFKHSKHFGGLVEKISIARRRREFCLVSPRPCIVPEEPKSEPRVVRPYIPKAVSDRIDVSLLNDLANMTRDGKNFIFELSADPQNPTRFSGRLLPMEEKTTPPFLTVKEAARRLKISSGALYRGLSNGKIRGINGVRIGRQWRLAIEPNESPNLLNKKNTTE